LTGTVFACTEQMFMQAPKVSLVPPQAVSDGPAIEDPVPVELRAVLDLFANQLAKVAFPDVDVGVLQRQADELRTGAAAVAKAREAFDAALAAQAARSATLAETAARGIAYARIYAEAQPDRQTLATALAALADARPASPVAAPAPAKRRGRPPKPSPELMFATPATTPCAVDPMP
jgi:hypothetical protein